MANNLKKQKREETLFEVIEQQVVENDQAFTKFRKVEDMPGEEPWNAIRNCLRSDKLHLQIMGVLMCGALESKRPIFFLSRTWLERYLKAKRDCDKTFKPKRKRGWSGKDYDFYLAKLQGGHQPFL